MVPVGVTAVLREALGGDLVTELVPRRIGHRDSHNSLLIRRSDVAPGEVSAIVVPTIRNPATMRDSLRLSRELRRPVIALCSGWSSAAGVQREAAILKARVVAVNVGDRQVLPRFATDALLEDQRYPRLSRNNDVSRKRNLGIAVARMLGWRSVLFLDDDITDVTAAAVRTAGGLLAEHNAAALENVGYPDNSVVCHARREAGMTQDTFAGGGAMAVRIDPHTPFFPTVYNEDWLFLVRREAIERVAVCGKVSQREYDPFLTPERARSEEFGDCLAEGVFALSERDRPAQAANEAYWKAFRLARVRMIEEIIDGLRHHPDEDRRGRMVQALKTARGRCLAIPPRLYVDYLRAQQADLKTWAQFLAGLEGQRDPAEAFVSLGLSVFQHDPGAA